MKTLACLVISMHAAVAWAATPPIECPDSAGHTKCMVTTENKVQLKEELSVRKCFKNKTWKFTETYIEVSGGCRGRFIVGKDAGSGILKSNAAK